MVLFMLAAVGILLCGTAYGFFCIQKGGIAAALSVFCLLAADLGLLALLLYFRINT